MTADPQDHEDHRVDPIDALQLLRRMGFSGRRLYSARGDTTVLHYRRTWFGSSDVVLVYAEDDAEAYRADGSLPLDADPLDLACRSDLVEEAVGTVAEVVATVTTWPATMPGHHRDRVAGEMLLWSRLPTKGHDLGEHPLRDEAVGWSGVDALD